MRVNCLLTLLQASAVPSPFCFGASNSASGGLGLEAHCLWLRGPHNLPQRDFASCGQKTKGLGLPWWPVVKTSYFPCRGTDSVPDWGAKLPQAAWCGQKNK